MIGISTAWAIFFLEASISKMKTRKIYIDFLIEFYYIADN
jgi:hypothetical protein